MTLAEFVNKVGFKIKQDDVNKVNGTFSEIKNTATKLLGAIGVGFSLTQINAIVEEYGRVNNQIKNSTAALGDQHEIQKKILESASATRSSYEQTAKTVSNLVHENKELFGNVEEAVKFNNAATMLFKTAGKTNEDIASLMEAINKSFAKGKVDTETINQLLERSPEAVELLNKKLGTTSDKLEEMVSQGTMSVADLKAAFVDNADEIEKKFGNVQYTISDALLHIRNKWGFWLADMDKTMGVTNSIGKVMVSGFNSIMNILNKVRNGFAWLSEKVGGAENLLKLIAITAGSLFIAFKFQSIKNGLNTMLTWLGKIKLQTMLAAGVIILIALLVEDFINFMQGNDSVLGEAFEKMGIDADAARQFILDAWEEVTNFFEKCGEVISTVTDTIRDKIGEFNDKISEGVDWLKEHQTALGLVAIAVGTLTAAIIAYNVAQAIKNAGGIAEIAQLALLQVQMWGLTIAQGAHTAASWIATAATTAFGAAMAFLTSPITLVILAIGALIAIIFVCIKNWDKIKEAAAKCWDWICGIWEKVADWFNTKVVQPLVEFFKGLWDGIVSIFSGVSEWFTNIFTQAWEGIKNVFSTVGAFFSGVWNTIVNIFTSIGTTVGNAIGGAFKAVVNAIISFAENTINGFIKAINGAIGLINKIPGVNINKIALLNIPRLAEGGYVEANSPQHVIIGDNTREGEIVSPVSKMKEAMYDVIRMFAYTVRPSQTTQSMTQSPRSYVVNQNVEINNEFNGDTAIQRNASKAMDNSAKDVTAQLARGLAYVR